MRANKEQLFKELSPSMWSFKFSFVFIFIFQLVACGGGGGGGTSSDADNQGSDGSGNAPETSINLEFNIPKISSISSLEIIITSNVSGVLSIEDTCGQAEYLISSGENSLSLSDLTDGIYSNCNVSFVSTDGVSQVYPLPEFEIDSKAPVIQSNFFITEFSSDSSPEFQFNSNENGSLIISGNCLTEATDVVEGENRILFNGLTDGTYSNCQLSVVDDAGNISNQIDIEEFNIDTQAPLINLNSFITPYMQSVNSRLTVYAVEPVSFSLSNTCSSVSSIDGVIGVNQISLASLGEGVFDDCALIATDRAGNQSEPVSISPFSIDDESPVVVEISSVITPTSNRENSLGVRLSEDGTFVAQGNCKVSELLFLQGEESIVLTVEEDLEVTVDNCEIIFVDRAGNESSPIQFMPFKVDTQGPQLILDVPVLSLISNSNPQITLSTNEDASLLYEGSCTSSIKNIFIGSNVVEFNQLADGEYAECKVKALDSLNNASDWLTLPSFKVDTTKPQLILTKNVPEKSDDQSPSLIFNSSEAGTITLYGSCDSDLMDAVNGQNYLTLTELPIAKYSDCSLSVTDDAGNESESLEFGEFEVVPLPVSLAIWQGAEDSIITPTASHPDYMLYRSHEENCDVDNYAACSLGQVNSLDGSQIIDTAFNRSNNAYAKIRTSLGVDSLDSLLTLSSDHYTSQKSQTIVFNDKVLSYDAFSPAAFSRSNDGKYWQVSTVAPDFGQRKGHQIVEFKNKLWMIAGYNNGSVSSDVWSSEDGISWNYESEIQEVLHNKTNILDGRTDHQVVVFKDKLWLIGGINDSGYQADVWSSDNGRAWELETEFAPFGRRSEHKVVVFGDKMFVIGGRYEGSYEFNDVWSFDGNQWLQESDNNPFGPRYGMDISFFNSKWVLVGGYGIDSFPYSKKDVWQSDDLITWRKLSEDEKLTDKEHQNLFVFKNKLWITGEDGLLFSENAIEWKKVNKPKESYSARYAHRAVNFNGEFWLVGGAAAEQTSGDIYKSSDGIQWQLVSKTAPFGSRKNHTLTEFKGRLWVIAGDTDNGLLNDVWVSDDGIGWTLVTEEAAFTKREGHMVVATDDALYLMGGDDDNGYWNLKDVWRSTDGDTWNLITSSAGYGQDQNPDAEYFNNKLWIFNGSKIYSANIETPAVWSQVGTLSSLASYHNEVEIHNGQLFMYTYHGKLLSSLDGITWTEIISDEYRLPTQLQNSQIVSKDGYLWILSGRFGVNNSYLSNTWRYSASDEWRILLKREIPFY
jgi:hypothetical protein